MKKVFWMIWSFLFLVLVCLTVTYGKNERMIAAYREGTVRESMMPGFSLTQPYILPYNRGNLEYRSGNYDEAVSLYQEALKKHPPKDEKECNIRVNLALAMIAPYTPEFIKEENIEEENIEEAIQKIDEACAYLLEDGCANEDGYGHDYDAQTLYDELQEKKQELNRLKEEPDKQQNPSEGDEDQKDQPEDGQNRDGKEDSLQNPNDQNSGKDTEADGGQSGNQEKDEKQSLEDYLKQQYGSMQQQGEQERNQTLELYESWGNYSIGTGKSW